MSSSRLRPFVFFYPFLLILCGVGYAKYDNYKLDGDAVAFMDIADALRAHDFAHAVNGYWNPAYAGALMLGQVIAQPTRFHELQVFFWVNFCIFLACIAACLYFVSGLSRVRDSLASDAAAPPALSNYALILASLALLFASFQRELALGAVRSDALLLFFFLLAAGFLTRLQATGKFIFYPLLGAALGSAYLTKSFGFLPSGLLLASIFVFGLTRSAASRKRIVAGAIVAGIVFLTLAGPYIAAISKQRGRPTTGESARLNYAFFVDQTGRWHEWHSGDLGHATATFKHHEELLNETPPVYSYEAHPLGTYPLWFDPSYWTDTIQPKFYLRGHILRLVRCTALLIRFFIGHLEAFALFAVLLFAGCFIGRTRASWLPLIPVCLLGLVMFGIYYPIDFQDRYLTTPLLFLVIPLLAMLRRPASGYAGEVGSAAALLLAALIAATAVADIADRRRTISVIGYGGAYSPEIFPAAQALNNLNIGDGKVVACFGDRACYYDHYWARLAGTPIRAEIETPHQEEPSAFWKATDEKQKILDTLRQHHIAAIVGFFAPSERQPDGWRKLGTSDFYAYPLDPTP